MSVLHFNNISLLILILHWDKEQCWRSIFPIHLGAYGNVLIPLNATDNNIFRYGTTSKIFCGKVKIKLILNEINITRYKLKTFEHTIVPIL